MKESSNVYSGIFGLVVAGMLSAVYPCQAKDFLVLNSNIKTTPALGRVFGSIEQDEYAITWHSALSAYMSPNRAQNLRVTYLDDGFSVQRRVVTDFGDEWKITLELASLGSHCALPRVFVGEFQVARNTAKVDLGPVQFQYVNDQRGLRQNFLIREKPETGPLTLEISVALEGVAMVPHPAGVSFQDLYTGQEVTRYTDVKVTDAQGKRLSAKIERTSENRFSILVDDTGAKYPVLVDPLMCESILWSGSILDANWTWFGQNGEQANARFGFSVANAHRVIDSYGSYGSVIVGAPYYDNGSSTDVGKVYVFYCRGRSFPTTPDWTATGDRGGGLFGYSVAGSDIEAISSESSFFGAPYDIVIVGAPGYDSARGGIFVWKGGASGLSSGGSSGNDTNGLLAPDWHVTGDQAGGEMGFSVASAGDVNGDGALDIAFGSPYYTIEPSIPEGGIAGVYFGAAVPATTMGWGVYGLQNYGRFGWSVAGAGNVNGDRVGLYPYDDIIIGAPYESSVGSSEAGQAYVYLGGSPYPSGTPQITIGGSVSGGHFGWSVASFGHVSSTDTKDAVIIGAPDYTDTYTGEGRAYVYFANSDGSGISGSSPWIAEGGQAGIKLGYSVCGGDLNNDGANEAIISAPYYPNTCSSCYTNSGCVFIWKGPLAGGGPYLLSSIDSNICGEDVYDNFGYSVAYLRRIGYYGFVHSGIVAGMPGGTCNSSTMGAVWELWSP